MKKIVFYLYALDPSGGVKVIIRTANHLKKAGYDVTLLVAEPENTHPLHYENDCRIIYSNKKFHSILSKITWLSQQKIDADFAIATFFATAFAVYFSKNNFKKRLYYIQAYEPAFFSVRLLTIIRRFHYYLLARLSYFLPLIQIANCEGSTQGIPSHKRNKVIFIEPGIDPSIYKTKERNNTTIRIGHISRKEHRKGSKDFFDAIQLMQAKGYAFDIYIAFDQWKQTHGLKYERVFPSNELELATFYQSCDIVVSTVWDKGFGYPPLESMACGAICVGTPMDFGTPMLDFVPIMPHQPQSIVEAIHWCVDNRDKWDAMKAAALKTSSLYHWDVLTQRWIHIFES